MRSFPSPLLVLALAGCGAPTTLDRGERSGEAAAPRSTCAVPIDATALLAWDDGVAFARGELVQRMRGVGCDLVPTGAPVAAEQLLDIDDDGALYVFPAEGATPGALSTMLDGEYRQSMVARVQVNDDVTKMTAAGRGVWAFGVAPAGDALWQDACGPAGIFDVTPTGVVQSTLDMTAPVGVLSDARTFWSTNAQNRLVRTTADGSVEVGATVEEAALARCGANVCGVSANAVVAWNATGAEVRTITREDVDAAADEAVAAVTANRHGWYVTLRGGDGARVVFVP